ncbi:MAG: type III secretion system translocon subunit SctB [Rhodospirillaceae bacterium]
MSDVSSVQGQVSQTNIGVKGTEANTRTGSVRQTGQSSTDYNTDSAAKSYGSTGDSPALQPPKYGANFEDAATAVGGIVTNATFDVSEFFRIIHDTNLQMKAAAKMDRDTMRESQQTALKQAADQIRFSAALSLAVGIVSGAAQIGGAAMTAVGTAKAATMLKKDAEISTAKGTLDGANKRLADFDGPDQNTLKAGVKSEAKVGAEAKVAEPKPELDKLPEPSLHRSNTMASSEINNKVKIDFDKKIADGRFDRSALAEEIDASPMLEVSKLKRSGSHIAPDTTTKATVDAKSDAKIDSNANLAAPKDKISSPERQALEDNVSKAREQMSSVQQAVGIRASNVLEQWRLRGEIGKFVLEIGSNTTNYFAKMEDAKKAEIDAQAAGFGAKADESTEFFQAFTRIVEQAQEKLAAAHQSNAETMKTIIRA